VIIIKALKINKQNKQVFTAFIYWNRFRNDTLPS